jgi:hypothetical protein
MLYDYLLILNINLYFRMGCQCMTGSNEKANVWSDTCEDYKPKETTNENIVKTDTIKQTNPNLLPAERRKSISYMISVGNSEDRDRRQSINSVRFNVKD